MQFSHLHNHTQFSLLDGASSISRLYKKAEQDNMPAVAITDHGNMFGAFEFVAQAWKNTKVVGTTPDGKEIKEPVVKPVVGCEVYLVENRHKRQFTREEGKDKRYHQLFLAKDETGYKNLVKLCSLGFMEGLYGKYPRIDKELVLQYHEGLIATTCCIGASVPQAILRKSEEEAEKEFKWWLDLFGDDYYVELQRHEIPEQIKVNEVLLKFAKKYNVPVIASNDSHYVEQEDANAHDILLCINTGEKQSTPTNKEFSDDDENRPKNSRFAFYNDQFYFKKTEEMHKLFHDIPHAIDNTQMIVDKIKPLKLEREILLPHFKVPAEFNDDQNAYLEHLTWTGARKGIKKLQQTLKSGSTSSCLLYVPWVLPVTSLSYPTLSRRGATSVFLSAPAVVRLRAAPLPIVSALPISILLSIISCLSVFLTPTVSPCRISIRTSMMWAGRK